MFKSFIRRGIALAAGITLIASAATAQGNDWELDRVHSGASFVVRHAITPMTGYFEDFDVDITWDEENLSKSMISAELSPASVVMGNDNLSGHLQGKDFFDTENHGKWTFISKKIEEDDGKYVAIGDLTVRGVTHQVIVPFEFLGLYDTGSGYKAGFLAEFAIDRTMFDINYDAEGKRVGKTVRIRLALEMNEARN